MFVFKAFPEFVAPCSLECLWCVQPTGHIIPPKTCSMCVCAYIQFYSVCVCGCVCMECVSSLLMADPNIKYTICILHDVVLAIQMLYVWHLAKSP